MTNDSSLTRPAQDVGLFRCFLKPTHTQNSRASARLKAKAKPRNEIMIALATTMTTTQTLMKVPLILYTPESKNSAAVTAHAADSLCPCQLFPEQSSQVRLYADTLFCFSFSFAGATRVAPVSRFNS